MLSGTAVYQLSEENEHSIIREVFDTALKVKFSQLPYNKNGCEVKLAHFENNIFTNELIEENYAMLTEEQKEAIQNDDRFGAWEEMLAVAALKRQLDFLKKGKNTFEADYYSIETERAGRSLKIRWKLREGVSGYNLLGFKATGGFSADKWDEHENGIRIVDACKNGETTELLTEGEAYFYTFFLKPFQKTEQTRSCSALRFQLTIETKTETEAIEDILKRFEKRIEPDPGKENLSRALKELGSYVEMDAAFEAMEKSFAGEIGKSDRPDAEKERKIERLRDIVAQIRSKYEP